MSKQFNIGTDKKWFLGEDKILSFTIFGPDEVTPIDFSAWTLEFVFRKTDKDTKEPPIMRKTMSAGLSITGVFNVDPLVNTQRLIVTFTSDDTTLLKPAFGYRYSIKRTDVNNEGILAYGGITFLQATAH